MALIHWWNNLNLGGPWYILQYDWGGHYTTVCKKKNTRKAWGQQWLSDRELFFQVFCSVDNSIETWISFTFIMRWPPLRQSLPAGKQVHLLGLFGWFGHAWLTHLFWRQEIRLLEENVYFKAKFSLLDVYLLTACAVFMNHARECQLIRTPPMLYLQRSNNINISLL